MSCITECTVTCEVKIMFPLTKNRCMFFFGADLRDLLNMSCSVFFNHGRTSVAVVVGDVLRCGKEFYNNFSRLFTGMTSTDQNQISDLIVNSKNQGKALHLTTLTLQNAHISIHRFLLAS